MTYKASGTSLPPLKYKFPKRRNRDSKSKWLLILVIAIVCVVLAVTVIAVTIYLTSATDMTDKQELQIDTSDNDNFGPTSTTVMTDLVDKSTPKQTTLQLTDPTTLVKQTTSFMTSIPQTDDTSSTNAVTTTSPPSSTVPTSIYTETTSSTTTTTKAKLTTTTVVNPTTTRTIANPTTTMTNPSENHTTVQSTSTLSTSSSPQSITTERPPSNNTSIISTITSSETTSNTQSFSSTGSLEPMTTTIKQYTTTESLITDHISTQKASPTSTSHQQQTTDHVLSTILNTDEPASSTLSGQTSSTNLPTTTDISTSSFPSSSDNPTSISNETAISDGVSTYNESEVSTQLLTQYFTTLSDKTTANNEITKTTASTTITTKLTTYPHDARISLSGLVISSVKPFTLTCEAVNVPDWTSLVIRHQHKNNQSKNVAELTAGTIVPTVIVYDNSMTFSAIHDQDRISITLMAHTFNCDHAGKYSCSVSMPNATTQLQAETNVMIISGQPQIVLPVGIVDGHTATLSCVVEFVGTSGDIRWTFSPPGLQDIFYELNIEPVLTNTSTSCTTRLESTLTFVPGMYDNGSNFRCELIETGGNNGTATFQTTAQINVISASTCEGHKYEILNHPYEPCSKIIYCADNGPSVHDFSCPLGSQCYDAASAQCVLMG